MLDFLRRINERIEWLTAQLAEGDPLWSFAVATAVTVAAAVVWQVLRAVLGFAARRVESWKGTRLRGLKFQSQPVLSDEEATRLVQGSLRLVGWLLYALLFYAYVSFALGLFPATRGAARVLLNSLFDSLLGVGSAFVDYLPRLIFLLLLFFAGRYAIRLIQIVFMGIAVGRIHIAGFEQEWASPTFRIIRLLIIVFMLILAIPYLPGSSSPAFQAVSIFIGVLVSLGSSGAVANAISGVVLTYTRAFRLGDRVRIADTTGDVVERTAFVTHVRTIKNVDVAIPNAMVLSHPMINFSSQSRSTGILLHTTVTIGYDVPWQKVQELLVAAALATGDVEDDPKPFVLQTSLDDFYVRYELNATTHDPKRMAAIYSDLHRQIQEAFHGAGVEINSPHHTAVRDGNSVQIPDEYLPKDYTPSSFRLLPLGPLAGPQTKGG